MAEDQTKGLRANFQRPQLSSLIPGGGGQTQQTQQTQQQDTSGQQATGGIFLPGINTVQESTIKPIQSNVVLPGITENKTPTGSITPATKKQVEQGFQQAVRDHVDMESQNDKIWEEMYSAETIPLLKQGIKQTWDATKKFIVRNIKDNYVKNLEQQNRNAERGAKKYGWDVSKDIEANNQKIQQAEEKYDKYQTEINDAFAKWVDKKMNKVLADRYNQTTRWKTLKEGDWNNLKYGTKQAFSTSVLPMIPGLVVGLVTKNPKVLQGMVFSTTLPIEDQEAYEEALEYGATKEEATAIGHIAGIINAELESIGDMAQFSGMFKRTIKQGVRRELKKSGMEILMKGLRTWVKGAGTEGLTEGMQEFVKNVLVWSINNDKNVLEGVGESTLYGTILGGGGSTIGAIGSMTEEAEKNAQITERADKEALDYVMQGEERKAQRMQQAKQNMKDKFLNKEVEVQDQEQQDIDQEEAQIEEDMMNEVLNEEEEDSKYQKEDSSYGGNESSTLGDESSSGRVTITPENSSEITKSLDEIKKNLEDLKADTFLQQIKNSISGKQGSNYITTKINGQKHVLRVSDHNANAFQYIKGKDKKAQKTSIVIKLANKSKFKKSNKVDLVEFVYDPANMTTEKMQGIIDGIQNWIQTGEYTDTNYDSKNQSTRKQGDTKYQLKYEDKGYKPGVAGKNEKSISGKKGVNLRSKINKQTIKELAEKYGIKVEVIEGMIEILENGKRKGYAYGKYIDQVLTLSEQIKESTAPHELLHAIFDMIDPETKAYLISQVMQSEGWSAKQAEEWLADSFSNFFRTGKIEGAPKSTWGKIKMFFKRVRSFINGLSKWRSQLEEIFTDIIESEGIEDLQGKIDQSNSLNKAKAKMKQRFLEYSKNAQKMQKKAQENNMEKYQELDTKSEAFKKRFGDSKVVDENGNPLVVFHGTDKKFNEFKKVGGRAKKGLGLWGDGFYFTTDKKTAKKFSREKATNIVKLIFGGEIMPVYLSIKNPYIVNDPTKAIPTIPTIDELKKQGYDGVQVKMYGGEDYWEAFEPTQIKSAIKNIGTFDANNPDIRYQEAEDVDPNIQSPNEMVHQWGNVMVMDKFISEKQKKKAYDVSKDILVHDGSKWDGHPYMWMHTNKYSSKMIPNFENTKDNRYKEFSNKGIVVSFFTNNEDMSKSYADQRSVLANTKKFDSIEEFNEKFKDTSDRHISEISGNPIKGDTSYEITIDENGLMPFAEEAGSVPEYVLHKKYDELIKYKSVDEMYRGVMPRDVKEGLSDSEKIQAVKKYAKDEFMGDEWGDSKYDGVEVIRDGNDVIFRLRQDKELGRYKTEKQALANARSLVNKEGQYHYKGIIQNMHNPLVVDTNIYGYTVPNWNRLGNAYNFLKKTDEEQLNKLVSAIDDVHNREDKLNKKWDKLRNKTEKIRDGLTKELNENRMDNFTAKANKDENEIAKTNHKESEIWDKREKFDSIIDKLELSLHKYYDLTDTAKEVINSYLDEYNIKEWRSLYDSYMKLMGEFKEFYSLDGGEKFEVFAKKNYGVDDATLSILHGIEGVTQDNGEQVLKEKQMQTNDYVFYALRKGGYDGVIFGKLYDYGGKAIRGGGGNVLVTFNSNQFKSWDNADPTDSEFISYQKMDDEYEDAVNRGDTERAKEILREYAKEKGYLPPEDYKGKGAWVAPSASVDRKDFRNLDAIREQVEESYDTNLYAIANGISLAPDDYFGPMGSRYYMYNDQTGMESYYAIKKAIDSIQTQLRERGEVVRMPEIEVYRAVPDYKKKIASLQKDLDLFTFDKDGNPRVSDVSKLSKESQEDYARYKDQQEREVIDDADQLLYDTLRGAQNISDAWTVKEGMLQSGGEWVSPSLSYAKQHGGNRFDGNYKIIKEKVPADELRWDGNDIREWGFDDGREYVTKPVKNSRKNIEITYDRKLYKPKYDENGNKISGWEVGEEYLIPLSKRFNEKNPDTKYHTAVYHGSPYEFTKFDHSHMGEGEGAQAHGWGSYVAVDPNTGRKYAEMKHYDNEVEIKGKTITNPDDLWDVSYYDRGLYRDIFQSFAWSYDEFNEEELQNIIDRHKADIEATIEWYEKLIKDPGKQLVGFEDVDENKLKEERKNALKGYKDALERMEDLTIDDVEVRPTSKKRHLYTVEIPDRVKKDTPTGVNYLDEDMWISTKEAQKFEDAMKGKTDKYVPDFVGEIVRLAKDNKLTGKKLYNELVQFLGDGKRASNMLKAIGYDGIHYFGERDGEAYVIFDENDLEIKNHEAYQIAEYDYDENGRRTNLKFGEDNSEFDPSIFDRSREDQIDADKENEKSNPFYNAWVRYNAQNYKDDQLTLEEFINEIIKRGDKEQEIYDQKMRDIGEAQNDPKMLDLQLRAVKLMEEEGQVGKKFGKNVSKEVRDRQQAEVEKKREQLVKDIFDWMYPGLRFEDATYDDQKMADQKEAEWELLGREDIEEKLKYFKKDKNGNREAKDIKVENPDIKLEKILSSGKWEEIFTPVDRVIEWKTPQGQKGRIDRLKEPAKYKRFFEKIYDPKTKTKVEVKDVTKEVRALEKYRADEEAEKARKKKERQEAFAKKQQEEYKKLVRMKAFQKLIDMQWLEKYPFLSEDEIKQRYGFTDEEWKKITEQDEIKLPKKRGDRAISDFNKAVDSQVKALIEGLTWQNNMKMREAEKNLGEIGEIDIDVLLGRDEEKGQKEVGEFEKIAKEEKKKTKKEKTKRLEQAREDVTKVEIDKERENSKSEKERIDRLIKSTKTDRTVRGSVKQFTSDILTPVSTKIRNISKKIHMEVMRYFQNKDILTNTRLKEVDPFLKAMGKIRKENPVRFMDIWVALANRNIGYANGLLEEYGVKVPTKLLDTIYDEAEDVGLNINYLGSYYPLSVKAPKSFLEELMKINKGDIASQIEERIRKESQKKGGPLEESEITAIINEVIAGEDKGPDVNTGNKHLKKRNTEIRWTPKMLEYCDDPISTLISYIEGMTQSIERAKFLGKSRSGNVHTLADYVYNAKNGLTPDQQDELMDLLKAVFNDESPNKFIQTWRDLGTLTTLGSPSSTLTQLGDLSFSVYENGWRETLKAVRDLFASRGAFNLVDMGVLNRGEEYTNINSQKNLLQKAIHNVFKLTFFSTFDTFGKSTYIQSTWRKRQKRAKQGEKGDAQFRKDIMKWTDDEYMTDKIINDIKQGKFSQEVALLMYMKLSNIQPLTKAQMPKVYLNNPNGRLFYQFKTFGIKQLDYVLQETKEQTKNFKNLSTIDKFLKIAQVANMVFIMTLLGVGADELKDLTMRRRSNSLILRWLMGEKVGSEQIWEKMADNVLKLFGLSRYTVMQMKSDPVDAITSLFTTLPATNLVSYPFKDIYKAFKDDGSINWRTASSYQLIPLVGKYRYWIFGGGQEKQQQDLDKENKSMTSGGSSRSTRTTRSRTTRSSRKSR